MQLLLYAVTLECQAGGTVLAMGAVLSPSPRAHGAALRYAHRGHHRFNEEDLDLSSETGAGRAAHRYDSCPSFRCERAVYWRHSNKV